MKSHLMSWLADSYDTVEVWVLRIAAFVELASNVAVAKARDETPPDPEPPGIHDEY